MEVVIIKEEIMKYTTENALKEIKRRSKLIRQKHDKNGTNDKKVKNLLAASVCISLTSLFAAIGVFSGSEISKAQTEYGAFILSSETCGYVLTATVGFALGVAGTLIIRHLKK